MLSLINRCLLNIRLHNEKELLKSIAEGDECAFGKLFTHYRNRTYTHSFKLTKSNIISEEIVQDVFLKIWQKGADLAGIKNFHAYLFIVTRNHIYKVLKDIARNYKVVTLPNEDQILSGNDATDFLIDKEYNLLLQHAIDRLPNKQKEVYCLVKDRGFKRDEVAQQLHIQPETVKFHLAQAMKNIRTFCMLHLGSFIVFTIFLSRFFRNN